MQEPRDHSIDVRGLKIHYLEWGDPGGEPLILIHGFLDHARSWEPLVAWLQRKSPNPLWIIAPDCRGHGDSGWIGAGGYYHFADYLLDLDSLIHALARPQINLLGHSMGGTISFLYTGTFPRSVKRLVLVEGLGPSGLAFADAPQRMAKWLAEVKPSAHRKARNYSSLREAAQRLQRAHPRLKPELALKLAEWGMKESGSGTWIWKFDPLHRSTAPQPFYTGQALEFFRRIECPVLLVQGKESRQAPRPDLRERLAALARHARIEIPDAGHMIHHDNPEALAQAVVEFLGH